MVETDKLDEVNKQLAEILGFCRQFKTRLDSLCGQSGIIVESNINLITDKLKIQKFLATSAIMQMLSCSKHIALKTMEHISVNDETGLIEFDKSGTGRQPFKLVWKGGNTQK